MIVGARCGDKVARVRARRVARACEQQRDKMAKIVTLQATIRAFIPFTIGIQCLSNGVMLAFPSVLNPAIMDLNSEDIRATPSQTSWLASIPGIAGILGFLIMSPILQIYGRKPVLIIKNLIMAVSWVLFYYSKTLPELYVARIFQGISFGGIFLNIIMVGEFVHPSRRGYFTGCQKIALSTGTLICHVMAIWFNWRQIAATAVTMSVTAMVLTFFWKESPFFLAMKGRYDECERSFHYLNGTKTRNAELEKLLEDQKKRRELKKLDRMNNVGKVFKQLKSREFWKAFSISSICMIGMDLSGRNYFKAYVVQIMMDLTGSKSIAVYISIGSDLLVLCALVISCFVVKYFKRRVLLFSFGSVSVFCFFSISLILYLKTNNVIFVWPWLAPVLIVFVNFIVHVGVSPLCFVVIGEIFPLELKGLGCCLSGMVFTLSYGAVLKLTPVLMESMGLEGTYFVYASGLTICLVTLFLIMPETKDQPLLDIENNLKGVKNSVKIETLLKPLV